MDKTINLSIEEFTRLKDIETRFEILKNQMMDDEFVPKHIQIILGIEEDYLQKNKELQIPAFMQE